ILSDKLETLRASDRLAEAIRVGQTALDLARRTFSENHRSLALSYERLGQLHDQQNNRTQAKPLLVNAFAILEQAEQADRRARSSFAKKSTLPRIPTASKRPAISRSSVNRAPTTRRLAISIGHRSRLGRKRRMCDRKTTRSASPTPPGRCVPLAKPARRHRSK